VSRTLALILFAVLLSIPIYGRSQTATTGSCYRWRAPVALEAVECGLVDDAGLAISSLFVEPNAEFWLGVPADSPPGTFRCRYAGAGWSTPAPIVAPEHALLRVIRARRALAGLP
jgi:hypothetical protein